MDIDAFFAEALRVLRPGGVLAYWGYGLCEISADCDRVISEFYAAIDEYWPPERDLIEAGYQTIRPPSAPVDTPDFHMRIDWTVAEMLDYLETWSACQRARKATGDDPLASCADALTDCWGEGLRTVRWPLSLTAIRAAK